MSRSKKTKVRIPKTIPHIKKKVEGRIQIHPKGFAFVIPKDSSLEDIFIPKRYVHHAFDGDIVQVELYGKKAQGKVEGKVTKVVNREKKDYVGTVSKIISGQSYLIALSMPGIDKELIISYSKKLDIGHRVLISIQRWGSFKQRSGTIIKILGHIQDPSCDLLIALEENHLSDSFPEEVVAQAAAYGDCVTEKDIKGRMDLRKVECITIDPTGAKDFDDALSLSHDTKGYHLGVHIADVSYYVKSGSALDQEAQKRANSIYLPGMVIPMLPHALSSHLCSLQPHVDRLAVSVLIDFDNEGNVLDFRIAKSVIHSQKRFTYQEAKEILEGPTSHFQPLLQNLANLCLVLKKKRYERGSIEFALPDIEINLDSQGMPQGVSIIEYDITHQLVEECMLKANELVATHLAQKNQPLTYRVHAQPHENDLDEFLQLASLLGFNLPQQVTSRDLQLLFDEVRQSPYGQFLATAFIKSLHIAEYSTQNIGHYGLGLTYYTHFTSPIRRYVDLIVHRLLFEEYSDPISLEKLAKHCSEKERKAARIENKLLYLKKIRLLHHYLKNKPHKIYTGTVLAFKNEGIIFEIPEFIMDGFLEYNKMSQRYGVGQKIHVLLEEVNLITQQIVWTLHE